ncbi:hypothetical protein [Sphingomonas sp. ID0503]|uniref:hypothetical protein n=1 Tax=Sphingomonas sp. ID0503 TaxID=3399691 RepID=UPI003AFAC673
MVVSPDPRSSPPLHAGACRVIVPSGHQDAAQIAEDEWREDCAARRVLALFATKWTGWCSIPGDGACRAGVLLRSLLGLSKKMPTQTPRDGPDALAGVAEAVAHPHE